MPRAGALLYAVNTFGAAAGALAAGFWLPIFPGLRASYLGAMAGNLAIAGLALVLGRAHHAKDAAIPWIETRCSAEVRECSGATPRTPLGAPALTLAAFLSGFATLALEVLWTRMFALVLHNSVYSFTAILVALLIALAAGAVLAAWLAHRNRSPLATFVLLLTLAGICVALSPFLFTAWTGQLGYLQSSPGLARYLASVFAAVTIALLPAAVACGSVLPFLIRLTPPGSPPAGAVLGRLAAINTLGGVAGALVAGFALLPEVGLWGSVRAVASLYLGGALVIAAWRSWWRLCLAIGCAWLLFSTLLDPARLPVLRLDAAKGESLHEIWETAYGVVAVTQEGSDRRMRLDNSYTLGGVASRELEAVQADLPLTLAGSPRSAFFLGLGTGITAGAALAHPLERVTAVELIPEVAHAAQRYFAPWTNGLFEDKRARIVIGDGRAILRNTAERFDVIVSDLFVPWHAGTASLYSREHFESARTRLTPGGLFTQWLPLYQMSEREVRIVARTMIEVFPQVTLWRGDFLPQTPIVALVGQEAGARLGPERILASVRALGRLDHQPDEVVIALTLLFYAGNPSAARDLFETAPVHHDDRPVLEHLAAMTQATAMGGERPWLIGGALARFYGELAARVPPERDPYLAELSEEQLQYVRAGGDLFCALVAKRERRRAEMRAARDEFDRRVPYGVYEMFRNRLADPGAEHAS